MIEFLRRFLALVLLLCGGYLFLWPGAKILVVEIADFERGYSNHKRWEGDKALSLEEYKFSSTEGKRLDVSGDDWVSLAKRLENPDPELIKQRFGYFDDQFVVSKDSTPFNTLERFLLNDNININNGEYWLNLRHDHVRSFHDLPYPFLRPYKWHGVGLMALGLLVYALLPRKKWGADYIRYSQGGSVIASDLIGLVLSTLFFFMPCFVVWSQRGDMSIFSVSKGWIWLTIVMWLMGLFGVALLGVGLRYSRLAYRVDTDGLREINGSNEIFFPWSEIEFFQSYETKTSSRIGRLLLLFGGSLQAAGAGMVMMGNNEFGIKVQHKNGEMMQVMANALDRFKEIEAALKSHDVRRKRKSTQ